MDYGIAEYSASEDINDEDINVPVLHLWNKRDRAHCYDFCTSEASIHGPIRDEIEARKDGPPDEAFEFSENLEVCIGSCKVPNGQGGTVVVECSTHGVVGSEPVTACVLAWMDEIDAYWESQGQDEYETPSECQEEIELDVSSNPNFCEAQDEFMGG